MKYTITVPASVSSDGLDHCDPAMIYELSEYMVSVLQDAGIVVDPV